MGDFLATTLAASALGVAAAAGGLGLGPTTDAVTSARGLTPNTPVSRG